MKKLFIPLLITMTGLAVNSALAQSTATITKPKSSGFVTVDGGTPKELDAATTNSYLEDICGLFNVDGTWQYKNASGNYVKPKSEGDVFFVEVNDYWMGVNNSRTAVYYDQISKGVKKISTVDGNSSQATTTGTFYTHPATDVNKFFFIVRRQDKATSPKNESIKRVFGWYDEWSYVQPYSGNNFHTGADGYDDLKATWTTLMDGKPFPSPHNCSSSLETNHYVALDGKHPLDSEGHDFTAYLYIPNECKDGTEPKETTEQVGTGEFVSDNTTYYIHDTSGYIENRPSTNNLTYVYIMHNGVEKTIAEAYPNKYYSTSNSWGSSATVVSTKKEITETKTVYKCPYVFFYAVDLKDVPDADVTEKKNGYGATQNKWNVTLHWSTAFDKFANEQVQTATKYDGGNDATKGMQERYLIERSYDQKYWETVSNSKKVEGNAVISADGKTIVDEGLKPFDETTAQFGYTVWYRVTSYVEKSDGTQMSETTSNVIRVEIPGTVPFKLTLAGGGTSEYNPETEENTFTNTIISSDSKVAETITLVNGCKLGLYTVDKDGNLSGTALREAEVSSTGQYNNLKELANQIDNVNTTKAGKYNHSITLPAGDENVAAYQLRMEIPNSDGTKTYKYSNILKITNAAISNTPTKVHRSGTPDEATCAEKETFHNEITFKASAKQIGTGYYIYRDKNATPIMKLIYSESGFRVDGTTDTYYTPDKDGNITITDIVEGDRIAVGETDNRTNVNGGAWSYAVAYYDAKNNTYGSKAIAAAYTGAHDELVLTVTPEIKAANFSQPGNYNIYTVVTINWSRTFDKADTQPSKFEIYMKKKGTDVATPASESAAAPVDMEAGFVKIADVPVDDSNKNGGTYTHDETYLSKWQSENKTKYTKEELANSLKDEYEVYVKMITTDNDKAKNSYTASPIPNAGTNIYTGIEGVEAQEMDVKVVNGVVEVNGVYGMIKVIDATGAVAAEAVGTGDVTEIEGLGTGVYVVTAKDMKPTKILIK